MKQFFARCVTVASVLLGHSALADEIPSSATKADVVILGEVHDNPDHHLTQAKWIDALAPRAVVFEMLDATQAEIANAGWDDLAILGEALGWSESGWPDFEIYAPIFASAAEARIFGAAVPRAVARAAMQDGVVARFGDDAARFGLDQPLPEHQQAAREAYQQAAHCNALPESILPMMVDVQRFRDAELARVTLAALSETGGPVAVVTGNGHARQDWGMPVYLAAAVPDVSVFVLGQSESGSGPDGIFDLVLDAPAVDRPDPCEAFLKSKGG